MRPPGIGQQRQRRSYLPVNAQRDAVRQGQFGGGGGVLRCEKRRGRRRQSRHQTRDRRRLRTRDIVLDAAVVIGPESQVGRRLIQHADVESDRGVAAVQIADRIPGQGGQRPQIDRLSQPCAEDVDHRSAADRPLLIYFIGTGNRDLHIGNRRYKALVAADEVGRIGDPLPERRRDGKTEFHRRRERPNPVQPPGHPRLDQIRSRTAGRRHAADRIPARKLAVRQNKVRGRVNLIPVQPHHAGGVRPDGGGIVCFGGIAGEGVAHPVGAAFA